MKSWLLLLLISSLCCSLVASEGTDVASQTDGEIAEPNSQEGEVEDIAADTEPEENLLDTSSETESDEVADEVEVPSDNIEDKSKASSEENESDEESEEPSAMETEETTEAENLEDDDDDNAYGGDTITTEEIADDDKEFDAEKDDDDFVVTTPPTFEEDPNWIQDYAKANQIHNRHRGVEVSNNVVVLNEDERDQHVVMTKRPSHGMDDTIGDTEEGAFSGAFAITTEMTKSGDVEELSGPGELRIRGNLVQKYKIKVGSILIMKDGLFKVTRIIFDEGNFYEVQCQWTTLDKAVKTGEWSSRAEHIASEKVTDEEGEFSTRPPAERDIQTLKDAVKQIKRDEAEHRFHEFHSNMMDEFDHRMPLTLMDETDEKMRSKYLKDRERTKKHFTTLIHSAKKMASADDVDIADVEGDQWGRRIRRWARRTFRRVTRWVRRTVRRVARGVKRVWNKAKKWVKKGVNWVKRKARAAWNAAKRVATKVWNRAKSVAKGVWNRAKKFAKSVASGAKKLWNKAKSVAKKAWNTVKKIGSKVVKFAKKVAKAAKKVWNKVKTVVKKAWNKFKDGIKKIASAVKKFAKMAWDKLKKFAKAIVSKLVNFLKMFIGIIQWDLSKKILAFKFDKSGLVLFKVNKKSKNGTFTAEAKLERAVVAFDTGYVFRGKIKFFRIKYFKASVYLKFELVIKAYAKASANYDRRKNKDVFTHKKIIKFSIGPIPVWIEIVFKVIVGTIVRFNGNLLFTFGYEYRYHFELGVEWKSGFKLIWINKKTLKKHKPKLEICANAFAEAFLRPQIGAYLYSSAGPVFLIEPYINFEFLGNGVSKCQNGKPKPGLKDVDEFVGTPDEAVEDADDEVVEEQDSDDEYLNDSDDDLEDEISDAVSETVESSNKLAHTVRLEDEDEWGRRRRRRRRRVIRRPRRRWGRFRRVARRVIRTSCSWKRYGRCTRQYCIRGARRWWGRMNCPKVQPKRYNANSDPTVKRAKNEVSRLKRQAAQTKANAQRQAAALKRKAAAERNKAAQANRKKSQLLARQRQLEAKRKRDMSQAKNYQQKEMAKIKKLEKKRAKEQAKTAAEVAKNMDKMKKMRNKEVKIERKAGDGPTFKSGDHGKVNPKTISYWVLKIGVRSRLEVHMTIAGKIKLASYKKTLFDKSKILAHGCINLGFRCHAGNDTGSLRVTHKDKGSLKGAFMAAVQNDPRIGKLVKYVKKGGPYAGKIQQIVQKGRDIYNKGKGYYDKYKKMKKQVVDKVNTYKKKFDEYKQKAMNLKNQVMSKVDAVKNKAKELQNKYKNMANQYKQKAMGYRDKFRNTYNQYKDKAMQFKQRAVDAQKQALGKFEQYKTQFKGQVNKYKNMGKQYQQKFQGQVNKYKNMGKQYQQKFQGQVNKYKNMGKQYQQKFQGQVGKYKNMGRQYQQKFQGQVNKYKNMGKQYQQKFQGQVGKYKNMGRQYQQKFQGQVNKTKRAYTQRVNKYQQQFTGKVQKFTQSKGQQYAKYVDKPFAYNQFSGKKFRAGYKKYSEEWKMPFKYSSHMGKFEERRKRALYRAQKYDLLKRAERPSGVKPLYRGFTHLQVKHKQGCRRVRRCRCPTARSMRRYANVRSMMKGAEKQAEDPMFRKMLIVKQRADSLEKTAKTLLTQKNIRLARFDTKFKKMVARGRSMLTMARKWKARYTKWKGSVKTGSHQVMKNIERQKPDLRLWVEEGRKGSRRGCQCRWTYLCMQGGASANAKYKKLFKGHGLALKRSLIQKRRSVVVDHIGASLGKVRTEMSDMRLKIKKATGYKRHQLLMKFRQLQSKGELLVNKRNHLFRYYKQRRGWKCGCHAHATQQCGCVKKVQIHVIVKK